MTFNLVIADFKQRHEIPIAGNDRAAAVAAAAAVRNAINAGYATVTWSESADDVAATQQLISDHLARLIADAPDDSSASELVDQVLATARASVLREGSLRPVIRA